MHIEFSEHEKRDSSAMSNHFIVSVVAHPMVP